MKLPICGYSLIKVIEYIYLTMENIAPRVEVSSLDIIQVMDRIFLFLSISFISCSFAATGSYDSRPHPLRLQDSNFPTRMQKSYILCWSFGDDHLEKN